MFVLLVFHIFLWKALANAQGFSDELSSWLEGISPDVPTNPESSSELLGPKMGAQPWQPQIGQKIQVILDRRVAKLDPDAPLVPEQADIWDLDLFDTPKATIEILHAKGKRVFCYLSVGGSESWRPDYTSLSSKDLGDIMPKWKGERYLDLRSASVWKFMQRRIMMAYEKGCDGIDPDNVDPFNDDFGRGGGFTPPLTEADSVIYLKKIADEAHRLGMAMGMKNAESLLPNVSSFIDFAVNEECTTYSTDEDGCWQYEPLLKAGKPVFHFEYVSVDTTSQPGYLNIQSIYKNFQNLTSRDTLAYYCMEKTFGMPYLPNPQVGGLFSTVVKKLDLGGWAMYCDGSFAETLTEQTVGGPERERDPKWQGKEANGKGKGGRNSGVKPRKR